MPEASPQLTQRPDVAAHPGRTENFNKKAETPDLQRKITEKGRNVLTRFRALGEKLDPRRPARERAAAAQERVNEAHIKWINAQLDAQASGNEEWTRRLINEYKHGDPSTIAKEHPDAETSEKSQGPEASTAATDTFGKRLHARATEISIGAMLAGGTLGGVVLDIAATHFSGNSADNPWVLAIGGAWSAIGLGTSILYGKSVHDANKA